MNSTLEPPLASKKKNHSFTPLILNTTFYEMLLPGLPLPYTHESTHILSTCKALNKVFLQKETMNIIYHWMCKGSYSLNLAEQSLPL